MEQCKNVINQVSNISQALSLNTVLVRTRLVKTMGIEPGYKPISPSRAHLLQYLPSSQKELPPRSMQDSFMAALIPLSTDRTLQDKYITFLGHVRVGRLLEDMDIFAGEKLLTLFRTLKV